MTSRLVLDDYRKIVGRCDEAVGPVERGAPSHRPSREGPELRMGHDERRDEEEEGSHFATAGEVSKRGLLGYRTRR